MFSLKARFITNLTNLFIVFLVCTECLLTVHFTFNNKEMEPFHDGYRTSDWTGTLRDTVPG